MARSIFDCRAECVPASEPVRPIAWWVGRATIAGLLAVVVVVVPRLAIGSPRPSLPLLRIEIRFNSCDVDNAESKDDLWVSLRSGHKVWLNRPVKDLARGAARSYDVLQRDTSDEREIETLSDIEFLSFGKNGSDGWCITRVKLYVNGRRFFSRSYSGGHWLDNGDNESNQVSISRQKLEASADWRAVPFNFYAASTYLDPDTCRFTITSPWVRSFIETTVGHFVETSVVGDLIDWNDDGGGNGKAVEMGKRSRTRSWVDLDLEVEVPGHPSIDVDFNLAWSCRDGNLKITAENLDLDLPRYADLISPVLTALVETFAEKAIRDKLSTIELATGVPLCPDISVSINGGVWLDYPDQVCAALR